MAWMTDCYWTKYEKQKEGIAYTDYFTMMDFCSGMSGM